VIKSMNKYKRVGCIALIFLGMGAMVAEAGSLYRYRNKEGNLVIDHGVPPEYVAGGYEIISKTGRVEQVVPPQRDPEELAVGPRVSSEDTSEQLRDDGMLLRSYSDVSEIKAAGERRTTQLNREVEIIQSNLSKNQDQQQNARIKAANYQLSGKPVPKSLLKYMDELVFLERDAEQMLELRQLESEVLNKRYTGYRLRFIELKGLPSHEKTPTLPPTTAPANAPSDVD